MGLLNQKKFIHWLNAICRFADSDASAAFEYLISFRPDETRQSGSITPYLCRECSRD